MRVRIVGVKTYTVNGKTYRYWRRKGAPSVRLDPNLSGAALAAEIARLEAKYIEPKARAGTLRLLIIEYKTNADHWRGLRPRTRKDYERVFTWLGAAMDASLLDFEPHAIAKLRDKARDEHEPKFANQVVTTLKMVFAYGYEQGLMDGNPAKDISKATGGNKRENRPCTPHESVALIDHAPDALRVPIAISLYTGLRLGDVHALTKSADKGEWLETIQGKSRKAQGAGKLVRLHICPDLRWILDGVGKNDATALCVKDDGTPWAYEGLKTAFQRHRDALEAKGIIAPGVTFHGLRHTVATILEEAGFDELEYRHQMGHGPKTISGHYAMTAERRDLLTRMALTIEERYRFARGNVVKMERKGNRSV